jgi:hypothetical protein
LKRKALSPSFLSLYQASATEEAIRFSRTENKIQKMTGSIEELAGLGIPGWQIRWFLRYLKQQGLEAPPVFEKDHWPEMLENYLQGPASDLYYGLCAAVFGLNPERDDIERHSRRILIRWQNELVQREGFWGWLNDYKRIDFGLVHGITGAALALSVLEKRIGFNPVIHQILDRLEISFQAILSLGRIEKIQGWPQTTSKKREKRIGWCRSDLSTGIALIIAAHRMKREGCHQLGMQFLNRVKQASPQELRTDNPYLCHGSSGNFYLLNLAFELTRDMWFLEQARKADQVTEKYLASGKFPLQSHPHPYHLTDLRNCRLPALTFHEGLDSSWDLILAFRDPFDQRIL